MSQVIDLIAAGYTTSTSGTQKVSVSNRKTVFCEFKSVSMREVYKALAVNRNPEIVAVLSDYYDYDDEQFAVIGLQVYKVLRTYRDGNKLELTLEKTRDLDGVI